MAASIADSITALGSADSNVRAAALAALVRSGSAATTALRETLGNADAGIRRLAAQALAEIADPGSAEAFAHALQDDDAAVRARAAQGLARLKDERAVDALVQTIDDLPDVLRHPYTSSLYALIDIGSAALPVIAPLLKAPDPVTRTRALVAVRTIASRMPGAGDAEKLWRSLGSYDPEAPDAQRDRAADLWLQWVDKQAASAP